MKPRVTRGAAVLLACTLLGSSPSPARKKKGAGGASPAAAGEVEKDGKSRDRLLEGTEATSGLFTFHRSPEKLYLEIPEQLIGAPLGFSAVRVRAIGDFSPRGGSLETRLVSWQRVDDHLVLYKESTDFRAREDSPYHHAVSESFPRSPVFKASVERLNDESPPVIIDASKLFGPDLTQIVPAFLGAAAHPEGTVLESVKAFEDNVVARVRFRFQKKPRGGGDGGDNPFQRFAGPDRLPDGRNFEATVDYNFYRLPEDGFRPRYADERIGGFTNSHKDSDPRTGQALKAVVYLNGEFFSFARNRYQVYAWWRAPEPGSESYFAKAGVLGSRRSSVPASPALLLRPRGVVLEPDGLRWVASFFVAWWLPSVRVFANFRPCSTPSNTSTVASRTRSRTGRLAFWPTTPGSWSS